MSAFWALTHPCARVSHNCLMCGRRIDAGETYLRGAGFMDGTAWMWKECSHCEAVRRIYDLDWDEGYSAETFWDWSTDARDVRELRHAAQWRMKWRTRSGTLLPVPGRDEVTS